MPRLPLLLALIGLAPLLGSTGCDGPGLYACTEIGCTDGVVLTVTDNGGIPEGTFTLEVTIDGEEQTCVMTVENRAVTSGSCQAFIREVFVGDRSAFLLNVVYPLAAGASAPVVSARVQQGGTVRFDGDVSALAESHSPNGVDCPPTCRLYRAQVDLQ